MPGKAIKLLFFSTAPPPQIPKTKPKQKESRDGITDALALLELKPQGQEASLAKMGVESWAERKASPQALRWVKALEEKKAQ